MISMNSCLRIGHRGACGYEPENTLASFRKALELDVDMIELDVQLCKTGEVVVFHDSTLNRTTNGKGTLAQRSLNSLKKLDAGNGEQIPLLEEVLDLVDNRVIVNIELKGKRTAIPVSKIVDEYVNKKGWSSDNFLFSSFNLRELQEARRQSPHINIGVNITSFKSNTVDFAKSIGASSIHPSLEITKQKLVSEIHKYGMKVFVWTANRLEDIMRLKEIDVDGLFSDFPDIV